MITLFYIISWLVLFYAIGFIFFSVLKSNKIDSLASIALGYSITQVSYYLIFLIVHKSNVALILVAAAISILIFYAFLFADTAIKKPFDKKAKLIFLFSICLLMLSMWPFFIYGLDGYWHTANGDAFDALNGRDYYEKSVDFKSLFSTKEEMAQFLKLRGSDDSFVYSIFAMQYSTVSFFSSFPFLSEYFNAFLVQASINIVVMYSGIYLLAAHAFKLDWKLAVAVAFASCFSNLFFTTTLNMHEGSTIFASLVPYLLYLVLASSVGSIKIKIATTLPLFIMCLFVYPHPLIFFFAPFLLLYFFPVLISRLQKSKHVAKLLIAALVAVVIVAIVSYYILADFRAFKNTHPRAWGISLEPEMLLIYWGVAQSYIVNGGTINNFIFSNHYIMPILYVIAIMACYFSLRGYILLSAQNEYVKYFGLCWVGFFVLFLVYVADSYYFYKFLYTTQFFIILFFAYGIQSWFVSKYRNTFAKVFVALLMLSNVSLNVLANTVVYGSIYNQNTNLSSFNILSKYIDSKTYPDIQNITISNMVRHEIRKYKKNFSQDFTNSDKLLIHKKSSSYQAKLYLEKNDTIKIYEDEEFVLIKKPTSEYFTFLDHRRYGGNVEVRSYEVGDAKLDRFDASAGNFGQDNFVWLNGRYEKFVIEGKTDKRYVGFCGEIGPGLDYMSGRLQTDTFTLNVAGAFCSRIPVEQSKDFHIWLRSNLKGHTSLPFDERELNYKIGLFALTDNELDNMDILFLNPKNDVLATSDRLLLEKASFENGLILGNGWYPQEAPEMRWGGNGMELIAVKPKGDFVTAKMLAEPGPGCDGMPLEFDIYDDNGKIVFSGVLKTKEELLFRLPVKTNAPYQKFKINIKNNIKKIETDPRLLGIRIFRLQTIKDN